MIGIKLLRHRPALALLPGVLFLLGARAAPVDTKPVWTFASTTEGTLNFTNYALALRGQANGKKFEVSLQCRRYHGDKAETIDFDFSADLANGKPFKFDRLAYRRDLEKMPSYIHEPAILAEDPLFTVRTHGFATAITISRGRYAADKNEPARKVWSETTREWTASGGSEKPAKAIFEADGTFREDPLWIDALYSVGAANAPSDGAQANLVWEAKIDLTGMRERAEKLVTLCGISGDAARRE